jgi:DegV family protein with EDD domain
MSVAIVSDTGYDLPPGKYEEVERGVITVPLIFRFGMEEFKDKSIPMAEFLQRMETTFPNTSAPSPGDFVAAFRSALAEHDQLVCLTLTSKHTTSYEAALVASQYFKPGQVTVIDSNSLTIGQGMQVVTAYQAAQAGERPEGIAAAVKALQKKLKLFIALDTVKNLVRGGRASHMSGLLAGVLQIRPVLTVLGGQLTLLERTRGRAMAKLNVIKHAMQTFPAEAVVVGHVGCEETARELASELAQQTGFHQEKMMMIEVGMVLATHAGPGAYGVLVVSA